MNPLSKKYGIYERQEELLEMMKITHRFLTENGIAYSLSGGTLLGAVREGGFIPWDDDVDIMMDRINYEKMIKLFSTTHEDIGLELKRILWVHRIQKKGSADDLHVPTIDVFVMDNSPDNWMVRRIKTALIMLLQGMMKRRQDYSGKSFIYKLCLLFSKWCGMPFSDDIKFKWYTFISKIGNDVNTKCITGFTDEFKFLNVRYTGNLFDRYISHKFEDIKLPITEEYDNYLSSLYGDYMTPPPESERKPKHEESF